MTDVLQTLQYVDPETTPKKTISSTKKSIVLWYHKEDKDLFSQLDQHLQLVYRRFGTIDRRYFYYKYMPIAPTRPMSDSDYSVKTYKQNVMRYQEELKEYQSECATAVRALEHAVLFVPCISHSFLGQFWMHMESDSVLHTILEDPNFQIMPIFVRPVETGIASYSQPLSAYEGYDREVACQQIASLLEAVLINHYTPLAKTPLTALFSSSKTIRATIPVQHNPTIDLLRDVLAPVQALLERTSAHAVESEQLALTERSQRLAVEDEVQRERDALQASEATLSRQVEEMRQQLTALRAEQHMTIFARIRRWFQAPESETIG